MWERRYDFPKPLRADTGVRLYTERDIKRLQLIAKAMQAGYRVGEIIPKSPSEIEELLSHTEELRRSEQEPPPNVGEIVEHLRRDDLVAVRAELSQSIALLGPKRFLTDVVGPLLDHVGYAWSAGEIDVRHEHLLSNILTTQLRVLRAPFEENASGPLFILATLSDEQHCLGIEIAATYLALLGARLRFLGADTPPSQLVDAAKASEADAVGISISVHADARAASEAVSVIRQALPRKIPLWVGGKGARRLANIKDPRVTITHDWADVDKAWSVLARSA